MLISWELNGREAIRTNYLRVLLRVTCNITYSATVGRGTDKNLCVVVHHLSQLAEDTLLVFYVFESPSAPLPLPLIALTCLNI